MVKRQNLNKKAEKPKSKDTTAKNTPLAGPRNARNEAGNGFVSGKIKKSAKRQNLDHAKPARSKASALDHLDEGYRFAEKILAWHFRNLWVVPDPKQRKILREIITYEIYCNREDDQGVVAPQRGIRVEWHDDLWDYPGLFACVEERIQKMGHESIKDIKEFPDGEIPDERIKSALGIKSDRQLDRLFQESGRLKSNSKQDVIDYIASREIDPPKPGKKPRIKFIK